MLQQAASQQAACHVQLSFARQKIHETIEGWNHQAQYVCVFKPGPDVVPVMARVRYGVIPCGGQQPPCRQLAAPQPPVSA